MLCLGAIYFVEHAISKHLCDVEKNNVSNMIDRVYATYHER